MPNPSPRPGLKYALLALFALLLLALFLKPQAVRTERVTERSPERPDRALGAQKRVPRALPSVTGQKPRAGACTPEAFLRCHEGDVWSEDSCGQLEQKVEECELQLCRDAACDESDPEPCREPSEGRCDGDRVRLCYAGRAQLIDCGARGMRCVQGEEGAECAEPLSPEERCTGKARCDGDVLLACAAGRLERIDCKLSAARCMALPPGDTVRCVQAKELTKGELESCGACGCKTGAVDERTCDGRDEDGDRHVDEGLSCGPVPVLAFVIADAAGGSSFARDEIEGELARVNALLASDEKQPELRFELLLLNVVREPSLLELSQPELVTLATDARFHPPHSEFYVPVVFSDHLYAPGEVPRMGVSTLPNGYCGGVQRGQGPGVGIIGIAKSRSPTTLLHELGHFLGLCHTHDQTYGLQTVAAASGAGTLVLCDERCQNEGDGVCDTPFDPGPPQCSYDASCRATCQSGELPDVKNVMSYYTPCRERFSAAQRRTIEHTLALRRAWHPCLSRGCPCTFADAECPTGMGCRPLASSGREARCALAGPRAPGAACESHAQCAEGSLCVAGELPSPSRCARYCHAARPDCTCVETSLELSLCREDLVR